MHLICEVRLPTKMIRAKGVYIESQGGVVTCQDLNEICIGKGIYASLKYHPYFESIEGWIFIRGEDDLNTTKA
jgi:hypothetical protein